MANRSTKYIKIIKVEISKQFLRIRPTRTSSHRQITRQRNRLQAIQLLIIHVTPTLFSTCKWRQLLKRRVARLMPTFRRWASCIVAKNNWRNKIRHSWRRSWSWTKICRGVTKLGSKSKIWTNLWRKRSDWRKRMKLVGMASITRWRRSLARRERSSSSTKACLTSWQSRISSWKIGSKWRRCKRIAKAKFKGLHYSREVRLGKFTSQSVVWKIRWVAKGAVWRSYREITPQITFLTIARFVRALPKR